jgi:hypothetical protein
MDPCGPLQTSADALRHLAKAWPLIVEECRSVLGSGHKLAAHRDEVRHRHGDMHPAMMVIDTAPLRHERMDARAIAMAGRVAQEEGVSFLYLSLDTENIVLAADALERRRDQPTPLPEEPVAGSPLQEGSISPSSALAGMLVMPVAAGKIYEE